MAAPGAIVSVRASSPCPKPRMPATQAHSLTLSGCLVVLLCQDNKHKTTPVPSRFHDLAAGQTEASGSFTIHMESGLTNGYT